MDYEDIIDTLNNKLLRKVFSTKQIDNIIKEVDLEEINEKLKNKHSIIKK